MGSVRTSILGGPRPLSSDRRAQPDYTLSCEEPLMAPAPAEATGKGLGSAPSSSSESSQQSEKPSPSESSDGGLTDSGSGGTEPSAPKSPDAAKAESAPTPTRIEPQAVAVACTAGTVYSSTGGGQIQRVDANGTVTNVGKPAPTTLQLNGLGISAGGQMFYGFDRTGSSFGTATMYSFNPATEQWTKLTQPYDTTQDGNGKFAGSLVAGAVDLSPTGGDYYFGGFTTDGKQFKLWRFNTGTNGFRYMGFIDTSVGGSSNSNGDLAFDNQGNLFIVRGLGTNTTVFSVTNDALGNADGNQIVASAGESVAAGMSGVNGVAFDAAGKVYLSNGNTVRSYNMPDWNTPTTIPARPSLGGLTDLATCSSPATITVEKDVKNRVNAADQFGLKMVSGGKDLASTTTTGTTNGIQKEILGPLPAARGAVIGFSESAAGSTVLSNYASSYSCTVDGRPMNVSGNGTSSQVTIPATGNEIVCRFVNSPLTAEVTINKKTQDQNGANTQNAAGWTVGAKATATSGTVSRTPNQDTQQTGTDGNAKWTLTFGSASSRANLAVSESQQTGYQFVSGSCKITRLDGTTANVTLNGEAEQSLSPEIQAGDKVECGYVNKKTAADVTVNKKWVIDGKTIDNGSQPNGMSAKLLLDPAGQPAGDPAFGQKRTGFAVGDTVKIGETATFDAQKFPGCTVKSKTIAGPGIDGTIPLTDNFSTKLPNASNVYTLTNTVECQTLKITKNVENDNGGTLTAADWNQKLFATPGSGSRLTFDSGEKKYVTAGTYEISENTLPGYEQMSIKCTGATYNESTKKVEIAAGKNAECIVTNGDSPGTVSWDKVNESGDLLDGSEWTIRDADGNEIALDDCVAASAEGCSGRDKNPAAGKFRVEDLKWGDYTLVETKAPAGYKLDETPRKFTISREKLDFAFDEPIVNQQAKSPQLPFTGGIGTVGFVIAGAALLLAGAAAALWQYRRRMHGAS
ncbi:SpaA isopeptide-forming pilin-related protein [Brevibacterium metallidurans]|uniref:SpaA isopeptide-forming pilin-related protein n=1 Tax=Brevibacterium metallidurans TaxID=1482676 RepID=UPI0030DD7561